MPPSNVGQLPAVWFWPKVAKSENCWEWTGALKSREPGREYGRVGYGNKIYMTHRVSWELHFGPIPKGLEVCHACDNPRCVRPDHLFLGTHIANMRDRDRKKRRTPLRGEQHGSARLTQLQVDEIRRRYVPFQVSLNQLAHEYNVSKRTILRIVQRVHWREAA